MDDKIVSERQAFIDWMLTKELKDMSIKNYLYYYDKRCEMEQGKVDRFVNKHNNNPIARAFINNYRTFLIQYGLSFNPDLNIQQIKDIALAKITGSKGRKIPEVITENQVLEIEKYMSSERNKLMLLITFYGCLRLKGLLNIRPYDFQWKEWDEKGRQTGLLKVNEKGDKERYVFMPKFLMERIEVWIRDVAVRKDPNPINPIFQGQHEKPLSDRRWQHILEKASLKAGFRIHPHTLRHSGATWLLKNGMPLEDIQKYLDHESIATTLIYTHISMDELENKFTAIMDKKD